MDLCIPHWVAVLYSRRLLPRRLAHSLFYRSALKLGCYETHSITRRVDFGAASFLLELPLRFKQNWTILFEDFSEGADALALRVFRLYARNANFIFDIGMNAGLYLFHAAAVRADGARVYGFEPNRELIEMVSRNIAGNQLAGVEVVNKCIAADAGVAEFFLTDTEYMNSLSEEFLRSKGRPVLGSIEVPVIRLDDFVSQNRIGADLLKIDVEGLEPSVIAGAWQTIKTHKPFMLIEIADSNVGAGFVDDLMRLGYRCLYLCGERLIEIEDAAQVQATRSPGDENYLFTMEAASELQALIAS